MAPFGQSRLRSKLKLKPEAQAEEAAPGGLERGTLNGAEGGTTLIVDSDNSPVRPPSPPPIPVEFAQSPMAMRTPMARTLSFARTKPSREEEAELYAQRRAHSNHFSQSPRPQIFLADERQAGFL